MYRSLRSLKKRKNMLKPVLFLSILEETRTPRPELHPILSPAAHANGPRPTEIHPRVLTTMSQPAIGYLDPIFVGMMEELKSLLRYVYQTNNPLTFPVSGPGSVGMEYCFVNLVKPGDKVVVCRNGVFGGRMIENVERAGGIAVVVDAEWGTPVDPQKLEEALKKNRDARVVAFVHAETSTGVQSDARTLVEIAHKYDALTIVDAVTSLGGCPVKVDEWNIDAITRRARNACPARRPSPVSFSAWSITSRRALTRPPLVHGHEPAPGYWARPRAPITTPRRRIPCLRRTIIGADPRGRVENVGRQLVPHRSQGRLEAMGLKFLVKEKYQPPDERRSHT